MYAETRYHFTAPGIFGMSRVRTVRAMPAILPSVGASASVARARPRALLFLSRSQASFTNRYQRNTAKPAKTTHSIA